MPSGSMSPQARSWAGDGLPTLACQSCLPCASKAYTESFSVATTITPSTAIGEAYTAPSSLIDSVTVGAPLTFGMECDRPLCEGSPWYIAQSGGAPAVPLADAVEDGAAVEVAAAGGVEDGAGLADPEQPIATRASRTINAPARRLAARPRARCSTPHLYHRPRGYFRSLADGHSSAGLRGERHLTHCRPARLR